MKRVYPVVVCVLAAAVLVRVGAVEPNYVRITTYDVNGQGSNVVTTSYSDGLGRSIQSKLKLGDTKDRTTCTFYDNAGRPAFVTKPFVDDESPNTYLAGDLHSTAVEDQLEDQYPATEFPNNDHLYTETMYWNDPLGQVKTVLGPGRVEDFGFPRSWTLGVAEEIPEDDDDDFDDDGGYTITGFGTVTFENGFITEIDYEDGKDIVSLMDEVYSHFIASNPFPAPTHFLTVSRAPDEKVSEELNDVFGRTVKTFSSPGIKKDGAVVKEGMEISARYYYDILGNVLEEIPPVDADHPLGNTSYTYNTLGQLISKDSPDGGTIVYEYYDDGSLRYQSTFIDEVEVRKIEYTYDELGRLTGQYEHNKTTVPQHYRREVVALRYDNVFDAIKGRNDVFAGIDPAHLNRVENTKGRLAAAVYSNYSGGFGGERTCVGEVYSYDDEGRLRFKLVTIEGMPGIQSPWWEYDLHGKVTADFCFYGGKIIKKSYEYDNFGRLLAVYHNVTDDGGKTYDPPVMLASYTYDDIGAMQTKHFNKITGYEVGYDYDLRDRLDLIGILPGTKGFAQTIPTYDLGGNIADAVYRYFEDTDGSSDDYSMLYQYDGVNRLKKVFQDDLSNEVCSYDYDQIGRFKSKVEDTGDPITGYTYYENTNRLEKTSKNPAGEEYVYDTFGNMIVDFTKMMVVEYDWRDMPVAFRFYTSLPSDITVDNGICTLTDGVYRHMWDKVEETGNGIDLLSTVYMYYTADGKRIGKTEVKEQ